MSASVFLARQARDRSQGCVASRSLIGRAVARTAIHRLTGRRAVIGRRPSGRPVARWADGGKGAPPSLSISYCAGCVGVAIAEGSRIGLDLEPRRSVAERVALRVMSPADAEHFRRLGREERRDAATRYWTCAEALAKASGKGLPQMLARSATLGFASSGSWERCGFAVYEVGDCIVCTLAYDSNSALDRRMEGSTLLDRVQIEELSVQSLCSIGRTI